MRVSFATVVVVSLIIGAVMVKPLTALLVWVAGLCVAFGIPDAAAPLILGLMAAVVARILL